MVSVPLIALACICIALGRFRIRRARREGHTTFRSRVVAWLLLLAGFILMILGVLLWEFPAR